MPIIIPYEELTGSPVEKWDAEAGFTATRVLQCDYDYRLLLAGLLISPPGELYENAAIPVRARSVESIVPLEGKISAGDVAGRVAHYEKAILTVRYDAQGPSGQNDLFSESIDPTAEFLTIDPKDYKWPDGVAVSDEEAPGKLFRGLDYVLTLYNVIYIPSAVFSLCGKVNDAAVTASTLNRTFPAETLLYNPPTATRKVIYDAETGKFEGAWQLVIRLSYNPNTWNKVWRAKTQKWERMQKDGVDVDLYESGDFSALYPKR